MKIQICKQVIIAVLASLAVVGTASAQVIPVDFYNGSSTGQTPGTSAVVGPYATAGWYNEVDPSTMPGAGTLSLVNNSNASTGVTFGFTQGGNALNGVAIYNSSHGVAGSANATLTSQQQLFNGAVAATGNGATGGYGQQLVLQNIPYATYSLYVIVEATGVANDTPPVSGSVQIFNGGTAGGAGTTYYFSNTIVGNTFIPADPITYTQATSTNSAAPTVGANYVLFSGLTSSNVTFDLLQTSQPASYQNNVFIGGFEIVGETAAVPEPSTYALMLGGLGLLVAFARRRRLV